MSVPTPGRLIIISGPSGAGKTTVVRRLLAECPLPLKLSVSATTRPARPGEQAGVDYFFLTPEQFAEWRENGEFLECFEVFGRGHWYGTPQIAVATSLEQGFWVILEIDVQGAQRVKALYPEAATIFLRPQSLEELERRLRDRRTESEDKIQSRLETARHEWAMAGWYDYQVLNDTVDQAVQDVCNVLTGLGA